MINKEPFWDDLLNDIKSHPYHTVYVVGNTDCGKTTLSRFLVQELAQIEKVAWIDCDPGQSNLGLPTTLNAGIYDASLSSPQHVFSRFIGVTTPQRKPLLSLLSIVRLHARVVEQVAKFTIMDSSGYSAGPAAVEFQAAIIEAIKPDLVILVEREQELEALNQHVGRLGGIELKRIPVSQYVTPRSMPIRKEYRENKFREYFQNSDLQVVDISNLTLCGSLPERYTVQNVRGRIIAFLDNEKFIVSLAIARSIYDNDQICVCLVPQFDVEKASFLHLGEIFLDAELREDHSKQVS